MPALRRGERLDAGRLRAGGQPGHRHGFGGAQAARRLLFHRRRNPERGRCAARRRGLRQQPLHRVRPVAAPGLRGDRPGRGARRAGAAGGRVPRCRRAGRRHHHQRRRERGRGRLHQGDDEEAGRRGVLEDRDAPGASHGRRPHRPGHPVRAAGQPGGRDGDLPGLRAPRPAAHDGLHRRSAAVAARRAARSRSARRPAAPNTSAAASPLEATAACRFAPPATRVRACSVPWSRPTA